jgi:hypothetical protein
MVQKKLLLKGKLKHTGFWNYQQLYNFCFDWLRTEGYKLKEILYNEKIQANGREVIIEWEAKKKVTDYFQNLIKIKWHILGMKDAEVEQDGKKIKTQKGEVAFEYEVSLIKDYEERWEDRPFWKFLRGVYEKHVIRTTVDEYEDRLEDEANDFFSEIKAFLDLQGR